MQRPSITLVVASVLVFVFTLPDAVAQTYRFTRLADTLGPYREFSCPRLNSAGSLVAVAALDTGGQVLLTGDGHRPLKLLDATSPDGFSSFGVPGHINRRGLVSYSVRGSTGSGTEVRIAGQGAVKTVARLSDGFEDLATDAAISDNDLVVFWGRRSPGAEGIYARHLAAGPIVTIVNRAAGLVGISQSPAIADDGSRIAFTGQTDTTGEQGIYVVEGQQLCLVLDSAGPFNAFSGSIAINNSGVIAFHALGDTFGGVFVTDLGGNVRAVALADAATFISVDRPTINNLGQVLFVGQVPGPPGNSLYAGRDPNADRIVGVGDLLDGDVVQSIGFYHGLNDKGQVAFVASFQTWQGLYRGDPVSR